LSEQRLLPLRKRTEESQREGVARVEEREFRPIVGPMGLWYFPILNILLRFLERLQELRSSHYARGRMRVTVLEFIRDREGRVIQILGTERDM